MLKIIHCADLHLDSGMETRLSPDRAALRRSELLASFLRLAEFAAAEKAAAVLLCGDLFDRERISPSTAAAFCAAIRRHPQILFFCLEGNHDRGVFSLPWFEDLPDNLLLFEEDWTVYTLQKGLRIFGALQSSRFASGDFWDLLTPDPADMNLVLLHGTLTTSAHPDLSRDEIPLSRLQDRNIDYLAMGHIHAPKSGVLDSRGSFCYPGCLEPRGFDEPGPHGFVMLLIDPDMHSLSRRFVPFARRRAFRIRTDISGCSSVPEIIDQVRRNLERENCGPEDMADVILTGSLQPQLTGDMAPVLSALRHDYFLLRLTDRSKDAFDAGRYADDRSLRGYFVRSVLRDSTIEDRDRQAVIRCGLLALQGESTDLIHETDQLYD